MELVKSLDVLAHASLEFDETAAQQAAAAGNQPPPKKYSREEKIAACRATADQISSPLLRTNPDFPRALSIIVTSLLRIYGDKDLNVSTVAEESLNKTIKALITTHNERITLDLFKCIKVCNSPRAQRLAVSKFADVCHFINPNKCRKFIISLINPIAEILQIDDESLQETLGMAMDKICAVLIFFLREREVNRLIELFMGNLQHETAAIRRSASKAIVALCRHYPKLPFDFVVSSLHGMHLQIMKAEELAKKQGKANEASSASYLGVLHCFIQLVKLSEELGRRTTDPRNPMMPHIPLLGGIISDSLTHVDHNVVGLSLELLQTILAGYGKIPYIWGGQAAAETRISSFLNHFQRMLFLQPVRVSLMAVTLHCLSNIAKHYTEVFLRDFMSIPKEVNNDIEPVDGLLQFLKHSDPLLRGNSYLFLGAFISGLMSLQKIESTTNNVSTMISEERSKYDVARFMELILEGLRDSSQVTCKLACNSLQSSMEDLANSASGGWILNTLRSLCSLANAYWLVKCEVLDTLARVNYGIVNFMEIEYCTRDRLKVARVAPRISLQEETIRFMLLCLSDADGRVRTAASQALATIIPNLSLLPQAADERHVLGPVKSVAELLEDLNTSQRRNQQQVFGNLSYVMQLLLQGVYKMNPDALKGSYNALMVLSAIYSSHDPIATALSGAVSNARSLLPQVDARDPEAINYMNHFIPDIIPLALDRLSSTALATDLDFHIDVILLIGHICKRAPQKYVANLWEKILRHIVKVLNILTGIEQGRPEPTFRENKTVPLPLGYFQHEQHYLELHKRLVATRQNSSVSMTDDKFQELRAACFSTLAVVIRSVGKEVVVWTDELLHYLGAHLHEETKTVVWCLQDLFYCTFTDINSSESHSTEDGSISTQLHTIQDLLSLPPYLTKQTLDNLGKLPASNSQKSVSTPASSPLSPKLVRSSSGATIVIDEKQAIRKFEPLVVALLPIYRNTHDLQLQQAILGLLCQLIKFGVDYSRLDKDASFLDHVINQILGKKSYLPNPPIILPYIFDFLSLLTAEIPSLLTPDKILQLTSCVFTSPYWSTSGVLLTSIRNLVSDVFNESPDQLKKSSPKSQLRDKFFARLLSKIPFPQAIDILILVIKKTHPFPDEWIRYSKSIIASIIPLLSCGSNITARCQEDLFLLYTLFDVVHPSVVTLSQALEAMLSIKLDQNPIRESPEYSLAEAAKDTTGVQSKLSERAIEDRITQGLFPVWLPSILILIRVICSKPFDEIQEVAEKETAGVLVDFVFKTLEQAYNSCLGDPKHRFNIQIFCQLLQYVTKLISSASKFVSMAQATHASQVSQMVGSVLAIEQPAAAIALFNLLIVLQEDNLSWRNFALRSVNIHDSSKALSWRTHIIERAGFLSYVTLLLQDDNLKKLLELVQSGGEFLKAVVANVRYPVTQRLLKKLVTDQEPEVLEGLIQFADQQLSESGASMSVRDKMNLLRFLQFVPPIIMVTSGGLLLLCNRLVHDSNYSIQSLCTDIFKKVLSSLIPESPEGGASHIKTLLFYYQPFLHLHKEFIATQFATKNPAIKVLFEKVLGQLSKKILFLSDRAVQDPVIALAQKPPEPEPLPEYFVTLKSKQEKGDFNDHDLREFLRSRFSSSTPNRLPFRSVELLIVQDITLFNEMLSEAGPGIHISLLVDCIRRDFFGHSQQVKEAILNYIARKVTSALAAEPTQTSLSDLVNLIQAVTALSTKCTSAELNAAISGSVRLELCHRAFTVLLMTIRAEAVASEASKIVSLLDFTSLLVDEVVVTTVGDAFTKEPLFANIFYSVYQLFNYAKKAYFRVYNRDQQKEKNENETLSSVPPTDWSTENLLEAVKSMLALVFQFHQQRIELQHAKFSSLSVDLRAFVETFGLAILHAFSNVLCTLMRSDIALVYPQQDEEGYLESPISRSTDDNVLMMSLVNMINTVGWKSHHQFRKIWQLLRSLLESPDKGDDFRALAMAGLTSQLMRTCLQKPNGTDCVGAVAAVGGGLNFVNLPMTPCELFHPQYKYIPREKSLVFLDSEHGKKLVTLETEVERAINQSQCKTVPLNFNLSLPIVAHTPRGWSVKRRKGEDDESEDDDALDISQGGGYTNLPSRSYHSSSPYHTNIERIIVGDRAGYYSGQLSINELRQYTKSTWAGIDIHFLVTECFKIFEDLALGSNNALLRYQAAKSLLLLSDLFDADQFDRLFKLYQKLYDADVASEMEDFLVRQYAILGMCKAAAVLNWDTEPAVSYLIRILKNVLFENVGTGANRTSEQTAALNGILYLIEAKVHKVIMGILSPLFNHIITNVSATSTTLRVRLHLLAVLFLLIEQYPKESEVQNFTRQAVEVAIAIGSSKESSTAVQNAIFRGFSRLLVSFSLSHTHRDYISSFALAKLPQAENAVQFLLAMGLMITSMYTGDEKPNPSVMIQDKAFTYLNNVERVKVVLAKIRQGCTYEGEVIGQVLPQLMLDFFSNDQMMSLILGEFARIKHPRGYPELMAKILFEVVGRIEEKKYNITVDGENTGDIVAPTGATGASSTGTSRSRSGSSTGGEELKSMSRKAIIQWVVICLSNFAQLEPLDYCVWTMTCLFLSVSQNFRLRNLFWETVSKVQLDEHVFLLSAADFYFAQELEESNKQLFLSTFTERKELVFQRVLELCSPASVASSAPPSSVSAPSVLSSHATIASASTSSSTISPSTTEEITPKTDPLFQYGEGEDTL